MALFKPAKSEGGDWLGFKEMGIESIIDKSDKFDWADVYLEFAMKVSGSQYSRNMYLSGSFDRELDGRLKESSLLKRLYHVFDILGFEGGVNIKGEFEDHEGNKINNIAEVLSDLYAPNPIEDPKMNLIGYVYKEAPRKGGNGKVYTRIHHYVQNNTNEGIAALKDRIKFLQSKGLIKEASEEQINGAVLNNPVTTDVEGSTVSQL